MPFYFYNVYKLLHTLKTQLVTLSTVKLNMDKAVQKLECKINNNWLFAYLYIFNCAKSSRWQQQ